MEKNNTALLENEEMQKELMHLAHKSILKKRIIAYAILGGVILLTIVISCLFVRNAVKAACQDEINELNMTIVDLEDQIEELAEEPIVVNPVAPEIVLDIINSEMDSISELATYEYLFTDSSRFTDSKQFKNWEIPFTQKTFTMRWSGVIKAGIDLEKVTVAVNQDNWEIVVYVPFAEILSYEIDQESVEVLNEKDNIFNKLTIEDKVEFDVATEKAMKERAVENGILNKAQDNAEIILTRLLLTNADIKSHYTVKFTIIDK